MPVNLIIRPPPPHAPTHARTHTHTHSHIDTQRTHQHKHLINALALQPHVIPTCCTDPHHHEVLREVSPGSPQNLLTTHTGPLHIRNAIMWQDDKTQQLCEDAVHRLQFSFQHCHPLQTNLETQSPGYQHF